MTSKNKAEKYEITIYTSCCNAKKGIYYYTTYDNHQINVINMFKEDLDTNNLIRYPLLDKENFNLYFIANFKYWM